MERSVYSLILSDRIVKEVDKLAYKLNTNRSAMINEILGEYLSLSTPENKIRQIISSLENSISLRPSFKILPSQTDATFIVKSALSYKYNPVIKYSVALYKNQRNRFGCIKAGIRTQNEQLIYIMNEFFRIFYKIENKYIDFGSNQFHEIENGKLTRNFKIDAESRIDDTLMGESISRYIDNLDKMIKYFFQHYSSTSDVVSDLERIYKDYLGNAKVIL